MHKPHVITLAMRAAPAALALSLVLGLSPASAARDRTPPTRPTNLHVTAVTPYSVSLAWSPSTDNSGSVSYVICCATTSSATSGTASVTFTNGVEPGWTHSFRVYAVDPSGNKSGYSNTVSVAVPNDTTPPSAPGLSVADVGSTYVSLSWTLSADNDPTLYYSVYINGSLYVSIDGVNAASTRLVGLSPSTTYVFNVRSRDSRNNQSPLSNAVSVTTGAGDPTDTTPPSAPTNLAGYNQGSGEAALSWTQSTDNVDPQFAIRYEIFVNGVFHPESTVIGYGSTIAFTDVEDFNTFEVVAVDSAGNRSAPAAITICMAAVC